MNTKERCINILHAAFTGLALTGMTMLTNGCDMIEYHPYDLNIKGDTDINRRNIQSIEASLNGKEEVSFILISDTQRWYDETEDAVNAINERNDVDFVIHCGDLSDFGMKMEFEKQRDILNRLNVPYVCLLGNHDCLATGKEVFNTILAMRTFPLPLETYVSYVSTPMHWNLITRKQCPTSPFWNANCKTFRHKQPRP